jgi:hypothetical protein
MKSILHILKAAANIDIRCGGKQSSVLAICKTAFTECCNPLPASEERRSHTTHEPEPGGGDTCRSIVGVGPCCVGARCGATTWSGPARAQRLDQRLNPGGSLILVPRETSLLQVTVLKGKPVVYKETKKHGLLAKSLLGTSQKSGVFMCQVVKRDVVIVGAYTLSEEEQQVATKGRIKMMVFEERRQGKTEFPPRLTCGWLQVRKWSQSLSEQPHAEGQDAEGL